MKWKGRGEEGKEGVTCWGLYEIAGEGRGNY